MHEALAPHFIIGGAPRSGTTALAEALDAHPDVAIARPLIPEPKVFTVPASSLSEHVARYRDFFGAGQADLVRGEKTSYYLEDERARDAIAAALLDVRLVFVLREPVARAYSNWAWSSRNGLEDLPFEEAVDREDRADSLGPQRAYARPYAYLSRGAYGTLVRGWQEALGPERVHCVLYEGLGDPGALARVQEFIGVEPRPLELPVVEENATWSEVAGVDPGLVASLRERFAPEVAALAAGTGVDVGPWGYG